MSGSFAYKGGKNVHSCHGGHTRGVNLPVRRKSALLVLSPPILRSEVTGLTRCMRGEAAQEVGRTPTKAEELLAMNMSKTHVLPDNMFLFSAPTANKATEGWSSLTGTHEERDTHTERQARLDREEIELWHQKPTTLRTGPAANSVEPRNPPSSFFVYCFALIFAPGELLLAFGQELYSPALSQRGNASSFQCFH